MTKHNLSHLGSLLLSSGSISLGCVLSNLPAQSQQLNGNLLQNGGFESQDPARNPSPPAFYLIPAPQVAPWSTTDSKNQIELWNNNFSSNSGGRVPTIKTSDPFYANGGNFFAELNANTPGTLSQIVRLDRSGSLSYSIWHRGRAGSDTMELDVQLKQADGSWKTVYSKQFTTGQEWKNYTNNNIVVGQAGQEFRFLFKAVSTATRSLSVGNFIDNLAFGLLQFEDPGENIMPDPFTTQDNPSNPTVADNSPDKPISPQKALEVLSTSIGATLSPETAVSGFMPRNTDAAPAGLQRLLSTAAIAVLQTVPQQVPQCKAKANNPKAKPDEQPESDPANCKKAQANNFSYAQQPNNYYGDRSGFRTWFQGFAASLTDIGNPNGGAWANSASTSGGGALFGIDYSITETSQLGVFGSATTMNLSQYGFGGGEWTPTGYGVGLYGRWSPGPWFLSGLVQYGSFEGDQSRGIELGTSSLRARGRKSADTFTAALMTGARINLSPYTFITPSANLNWSSINENRFKESGGEIPVANGNTGLFNLNYQAHNTSWADTDLGVSISQAIQNDTTLVIPAARISWFGNWKTQGGSQVINYDFSPQKVYVPGGWLDRNGLRLSLGVDTITRSNTTLFVRGSVDFGQDSSGQGPITDYGVNGGISIRF